MNDDDHEEDKEVEADPDADPEADPLEPPERDPAEPNPAVESIEEIFSKKDEGDVESLLNLGRDERLEPLAVKVVPKQEKEFVCKRCFLVKHMSQLKDKKRQFCRDCA